MDNPFYGVIETYSEELELCNGFTPTISVATHSKPNTQLTCIDNILVNNVEHVTSSGVLETHISPPFPVFNPDSTKVAISAIECCLFEYKIV